MPCRRTASLGLILLALAALVAGCGFRKEATESTQVQPVFPLTVRDADGREVRLAAIPKRVVTLDPAAARILNAGCPLDLDLHAFPVGFATRTLFDKIEIVLWRRAETTFHVEVWRSFAPFVAASLAEAARGAPEW